jgi:hypothetical protein
VATAVDALRKNRVKRIILARPAVEAGEKLGFLPGDLQEKVNPYLRPLYDALYDMLDVERAERLVERGTVEVAPIAFMRGRTLNDAFVILDEAQNTTSEQMKMFLTRLGFGSKAVITGDITQIDLPTGRTSGLVEAMKVVGEELERLREQPATADELVRARENVKARVVLGMESTGSRMHRLGGSLLFDLPLLETDEMMERIDAVTLDDVRSLVDELWAPGGLSAAGIGPDEDGFRRAVEGVAGETVAA